MLRLRTDQQLRTISALVDKVIKESMRQVDIYGIQRLAFDRWHTYLIEETGRLAEAIALQDTHGAPLETIATKAIKVATLALKIAEMAANPEE
jgi:hypothetical protein